MNQLPEDDRKKRHYTETESKLDDIEYGIKIILPLFILLLGLFGEPLGLSEQERHTLTTSGLFATGLGQGKSKS